MELLHNCSEAFSNSLLAVATFCEREAGHDVFSLLLIFMGLWIADPAARAQYSRDLVIFGLGVLSRSMGARKE